MFKSHQQYIALARFLALGLFLMATFSCSEVLAFSTRHKTPSMAIALPKAQTNSFPRRKESSSENIPYVVSSRSVAVPVPMADDVQSVISASLELPRRHELPNRRRQEKFMSHVELAVGRLVMTGILVLMVGQVITGLTVSNLLLGTSLL
jgi:hypothetical protein